MFFVSCCFIKSYRQIPMLYPRALRLPASENPYTLDWDRFNYKSVSLQLQSMANYTAEVRT